MARPRDGPSPTVPVLGGWACACGPAHRTGLNVNVPVPAGCTDDDYCTILEELLLPIAHQFQPDLVLGVCGCGLVGREGEGGRASAQDTPGGVGGGG